MNFTNFLQLLVLALATWRLTSLLSSEQGPNGLCAKVRSFVGLKFERGQETPLNWFASDISCPWCFSLYSGLFWTGLYLINKDVAFWTALPFALSTCSILVMTNKGIQVYLRHLKEN